MKVGVVDIGTNSMRLLVTGSGGEVGRWVEVTGLGRGVDATGLLAEDAVERTIGALGRFGEIMDAEQVDRRAAVATSATRDAANRDAFLVRVARTLGVEPEVIGGEREGSLAYTGATSGLGEGHWLISDIGGGSTEFVGPDGAVSIDIGSVRLTDRLLSNRPASDVEMEAASAHVAALFSSVQMTGSLVGVAGTWTSLAAIDLDLAEYDGTRAHHHVMSAGSLQSITRSLAQMTVVETAAIPSMDPGRAPVILAGAVVANGVMTHLGSESVTISERDTLDGIAMELMDAG